MSDNKITIKICPCCNKEITNEDHYVICSVCRTPHHVECWLKEKRCCVTGCDGTSTSSGYGKTDSPFYLNTGLMQVSRNSMIPDNSIAEELVQTEEFVKIALIGRKAEYYLPMFGDMDAKKRKICFNFAAFVFGWYWCLYRKLYLFAFIFLAAELCVLNLPIKSVIRCCAILMLFLANGLIGNHLYKKRIYKCAAKAVSLKEPQRSGYISSKGGVNIILPIIMIIVMGIVSVIQRYLPFVKIFLDFFD